MRTHFSSRECSTKKRDLNNTDRPRLRVLSGDDIIFNKKNKAIEVTKYYIKQICRRHLGTRDVQKYKSHMAQITETYFFNKHSRS